MSQDAGEDDLSGGGQDEPMYLFDQFLRKRVPVPDLNAVCPVDLDTAEDEEEDLRLLRHCFDHFKCSIDGLEELQGLSFARFGQFVDELLVDPRLNGRPHFIPQIYYQDMFKKFDKNGDNLIDWNEFQCLWSPWLKVILRPRSALIMVDIQQDFISGSLAIIRCPAGHRGEEVVPVVNSLLESVPFDLTVYSFDWHTNNHISFYENYGLRKIIARNGTPLEELDDPSLENLQVFEEVTFEGPPRTDQKLWPRHCVQNSWGAKLHPELLQMKRKTINVYKGTNSVIDSYSAFWDNNKLSETGLANELRSRNITDVYVCGIAYDVCVGATSEHSNEYGFRTVLINDASRGVDCKAIAKIKDRLFTASALVLDSDRIMDMVDGKDRRPELAYRLAMTL